MSIKTHFSVFFLWSVQTKVERQCVASKFNRKVKSHVENRIWNIIPSPKASFYIKKQKNNEQKQKTAAEKENEPEIDQ